MKRSRVQLPPKEYKKLCMDVLSRDGWRCRCCRAINRLHSHHIVFRSKGGDDADWNLITLCYYCHDAIHTFVHGRGVVVESKSGAEVINANNKNDVVFRFINGWIPRRKKV